MEQAKQTVSAQEQLYDKVNYMPCRITYTANKIQKEKSKQEIIYPWSDTGLGADFSAIETLIV